MVNKFTFSSLNSNFANVQIDLDNLAQVLGSTSIQVTLPPKCNSPATSGGRSTPTTTTIASPVDDGYHWKPFLYFRRIDKLREINFFGKTTISGIKYSKVTHSSKLKKNYLHCSVLHTFLFGIYLHDYFSPWIDTNSLTFFVICQAAISVSTAQFAYFLFFVIADIENWKKKTINSWSLLPCHPQFIPQN